MHQAGQGCRQDDRTALDFLKKAAAAGHDMAETALCVHYYRMRLFHKAVQWARRVVQPLLDCPDLQAMIAAQSPDITKAQATCCWHLSRCCANGTGVPSKDTAEAQRLFSLALRIDEQTVAALEKTAVQAERQS
ncbi:hypothetical protein PTSG_12395 [Salpingoeca rosetta]|uniref:LRP2-binding protein n=1 Tax=Salpingoeca rosetta (strain ATCC 50818 / BSB-021) TaxID=946362 RepID=F2UDP6_SALR5|nr:uncharacterized protein PTSG_12395 [Salpingoeca rosetta]EGD74741.1 hypothetical protein PTSG_12395 [Salpingoeca rosetta]|eukprot:XP_004992998.1 hypothetical protein PTSG_12395 [Salpingoeca rosetta]